MMYLKHRMTILVWLMAASLCSAAVAPISSVVVDNPNNSPPYNLQSITVGGYTVERGQLANGTSTSTLAFDPSQPLPDLDDLDISFAWSGGQTGNEFTVHNFNGDVWRNSNGDNPDFFLFEAGGGDTFQIAAILPGGALGQSITLTGSWGGTGRNSNGTSIDGASNGNGQAIVGMSWAITDLLDDTGNALTNNSIIEGLAVTVRSGGDPAEWCAVVDRPYQAREEFPEDGAADVIRDIELTWQPGWSAVEHIVYWGTDFDDVNDGVGSVTVEPAQNGLSFDPPGLLEYGQKYYWRVDEVNGVDVWKGEVWSFTVEPYAYPLAVVDANASSTLADIFGIDRTVDRSGITVDADDNDVHSALGTDMWKSKFLAAPASAELKYSFDNVYTLYELLIWNANEFGEEFQGVGIKDISIETSLDDDVWTPLGDFVVPQGPGQPGYAGNAPISLGEVEAQHVKLLIHSNYGVIPQFAVSEVLFTYLPLQARKPQPDDGASVDDPDNLILGWRPGRKAVSRTLTVSTDPETVFATSENAYDISALDLQLGETYTWTVDEVNEASVWEGDAWTFSVVDPLVFDNMESYKVADDAPGSYIWEVWQDGSEFGTNDPGNGSTVGANPLLDDYRPATGLGRGQSLPIWFDNTAVSHSEATRIIDNEDWTRHGIESLSLYFRKGADNAGGGQVYVKINDKEVVYQDPTDVPPAWQTDQWIPWISPLSDFDTDLTKVTKIMVGVKGTNAKGVLYVDDIVFHKNPPASEQVVTWFEAESGTLGPTMEVFNDLEGLGASGGQYIGTDDGATAPTTVELDGVATYSVNIAQDGVYKLAIRGGAYTGNSFWFRIDGATINTTSDPDNPGWIAYNFDLGEPLGWGIVNDYDDGGQEVEFTLTAGQYTLEVARREYGAVLDAIAIVSLAQ
ncbi:hypothetical protein ACFL6U_01355 [Planctomycetota bacterium]